MNESEFKKLLEKFVEPLVIEILKPYLDTIHHSLDILEEASSTIEDKLNDNYAVLSQKISKINNLAKQTSANVKKMDGFFNEELQLTQKSLETPIESLSTKVRTIEAQLSNIKKELLSKVDEKVGETLFYCKQAKELSEDSSLIKTLENCKQQLTDATTAHIKNMMVFEKRLTELAEKE